MIREINHDPIFLSQKSAEATADDVHIAMDLADTLRANLDRCVGMAANMIGQRKRIIAIVKGPMIMQKLWSYTGLAVETDYTDNKLRELDEKVSDELTDLDTDTSFVDSEILLAPEDVLKAAVEKAKGCRVYLQDLIARKAHMLSRETEKVLAALGKTLDVPYTIYNTMKLADIEFDPFTVNGKEYSLGYVYRTTEGTLRTEGRTSDWHSPGRDFPLVEGCLYNLSVEVYQNEADSAAFMISIAHTKDGTETYKNLAYGNVKKGEWTKIEGSYIAGDFDRSVLYVETTGAPQLSFEIKNFIVDAPNGIPKPKPVEPPMEIPAVAIEDMPSIREAYEGKIIPVSAIISRNNDPRGNPAGH